MSTMKRTGEGQARTHATDSTDAPNAPIRQPSVPIAQGSDHPLITIEPTSKWSAFDLRELWTYRELLYFLIWRDVKIRYKQTVLGAAWAIIQPLLTMLIFTLIFSRVARIDSRGLPYPIFAYAGLLPWTFFATAVTSSGNSLIGSSHLITKVYFPRVLVPAAAVGAVLVDFAVASVMLIPLMLYYQIGLTANIFLLPIPTILTLLLALAMGMCLSALNVKYRDVRFVVPFLIQLWMFLSPVAYPSTVVPERFRFLYSLNPLTGIVEGFRSVLLGLPISWHSLGVSAVITIALLIFSTLLFRKMEKSFADII